jgi:integrase
MASIQKVAGDRFSDGKPRWRAQYRDAGGQQVVRQFKIRRDAEGWLATIAHDRVAGVLTDMRAGRQTLDELYAEVHEVRRFAPATIAVHDAAWLHVPPAVRDRSIASIDAATIDRVLARVQGPGMREKLQNVLSGLFTYAVAKKRLRVNPAKRSGIRRTRAERLETASSSDPKRYLDAGELARLVAEIPPEYRCMVRLMASVGLRPGEAYALSVGQFNLEGSLRIDRSIGGPTKTGEVRTVRLPAVVAEWIVEHVEAFVPTRWDDPNAPLFGVIDPNNWRRRVFAPAGRRAQVAGVRVNDLRHTAVSFAVGHGASVYDVQAMVGHARPSITLDTYGELWDEGAGRLAERLDAAIRGALVE